MEKMKKIALFTVIVCLLLSMTAALADGVTATRLAAVDSNMVVAVSASKQIELESTPADADLNLTWHTTKESIATVDQEGVVTGVSEGTCTIYATDAAGARASVTVTVDPLIAMSAEVTGYYGTFASSEVTIRLKNITESTRLRGYGYVYMFLNEDKEVVYTSSECLTESSTLVKPHNLVSKKGTTLSANIASPSYFVMYYTHFMDKDGYINDVDVDDQIPLVYMIHTDYQLEEDEAADFISTVNLSRLDLSTLAGTSTVK